MQNRVYYYTSLGVLYNIATNKEIWLNSLWSMADYTELKYFINSIRKHLEATYPEHAFAIKAFFKKVNAKLSKTDFFAMSFSTAKDDVAMWQRFSKEGRGVCIVFDFDKLKAFAENNNLLISELRYPEREDDFACTKMLYNWIANNDLGDFASEDDLIQHFILTSVFNKDPAFRSEKEIRMSTKQIGKANPQIQYKLVSDMIRKSYILDASDIRGNISITDMITEIKIGPSSRQSERDLADFLEGNGIPMGAVSISKSKCPV